MKNVSYKEDKQDDYIFYNRNKYVLPHFEIKIYEKEDQGKTKNMEKMLCKSLQMLNLHQKNDVHVYINNHQEIINIVIDYLMYHIVFVYFEKKNYIYIYRTTK